MSREPNSSIEVDARGLYCPLPILRLSRALRDQPPGTLAVLTATDPAAIGDVEQFCLAGGHLLRKFRRERELLYFIVQKGSG